MAIVVPVVTTWNGQGLKRAIADISRAQGKLNTMAATGRAMQSVGRSMTLGLTVPLAAVGYYAVKTSAEFGVSMRSIQANAEATDAEMVAVKKAAIDMGNSTIYSANDAADAFLALTKAGVPMVDILDGADGSAGALRSSMNLAATEGMDLAFAGEILAQAMNAYGIEAKDSAKITDILAAGAIASTASVEGLASGLKYTSANAAALGQPLDDTVTALALLNNVGLTASTAGTSFNQMLTGLSSPTKQASELMTELGFSALDASGQLKPMEQIVRELDAATADMTKAERADAMRKLFNVRGARAANALLSEGAKGWKEMAAEVDKSGQAAKLAEARMSGIAGALEYLRGAAETAALQIGDALAPTVISVALALQGALQWFSGLSEKTQGWIVKIGLLIAVLGPVILVIGSLISAIATIIPVVAAIGGAIAAVFGVIGSAISFLAVAATGLGAAFSAIGSVLAVVGGILFSWVGVVIAVIAIVVALGVLIYKNWDKIVAWTKDAWNKVKEITAAVWDGIKLFFTGFWTLIKALFTAALSAVKTVLLWYFNSYKTVITTVFNAVKSFITTVWNGIKDAISTALSFITTVITTALNGYKKAFTLVFNLLKTIVTNAFDRIKEAASTGIQALVGLVKALPGRIVKGLGNLGRLLYDKGKDLVQGLIDGIKSMLGSLGSLAGSLLDKVNPFSRSAPVVTAAAGASARGLIGGVPTTRAGTSGRNVIINVNGAGDPLAVARTVKRAIEGYDVSQGRPPGERLALAW